jgi:tetratricopeptide (TPR) repeat protein
MKKTLALSLLLTTLASAQELSFGDTSVDQKEGYILQLLSTKSHDGAQGTLKKVPQKYQSGIAIEQNNGFYGVRYLTVVDKQQLPQIISDFKAAGFKSPLALRANTLKTTALPPKNLNTGTSKSPSLAPPKETPKNTIAPSQPSKLSVKTLPSNLSDHDRTRLIVDAQNAFAAHDYTQATIYYEMMVASDIKDKQILINLCYLYGREGSIAQMEQLIEGKRGVNDYYYAYGVGALESGNRDLYAALSPQLVYDKSGRLAMLCGYFYERQNNPSKSASFYKMAHTTNPNDPYILYAYARSVDIAGDTNKAIYLYTQLSNINSSEEIKTASRGRISVLRSM